MDVRARDDFIACICHERKLKMTAFHSRQLYEPFKTGCNNFEKDTHKN